MHHLVGLCQAQGVYLPQPHELCQRTENGFYRALPLALHIAPQFTVHPFDVPLVLRTVIGDRKLFFVHLAQTCGFQRATLTDQARCAVRFLFRTRTVIVEHLGERDDLALWTDIMVFGSVIRKTCGAALVGAMGRNEAL